MIRYGSVFATSCLRLRWLQNNYLARLPLNFNNLVITEDAVKDILNVVREFIEWYTGYCFAHALISQHTQHSALSTRYSVLGTHFTIAASIASCTVATERPCKPWGRAGLRVEGG